MALTRTSARKCRAIGCPVADKGSKLQLGQRLINHLAIEYQCQMGDSDYQSIVSTCKCARRSWEDDVVTIGIEASQQFVTLM